MEPEHKINKGTQPEITIQYLNLLNCYVDTVFVLSDLRTDQETSTNSGNQKYLKTWQRLS